MDSKKSNKISEIVRLQQILKKWKKLANAPKNTTAGSSTNNNNNGSKSIKFLKKTFSFTDSSSISAVSNEVVVPKGFLAICVGKELKRYTIPTEYLGHQAFGILLREAEEEFGFQQEGVLKIPCEVPLFEKILKMVEDKREVFFLHDFAGFNSAAADNNNNNDNINIIGCFSPDNCEQLTTPPSHHPQLCR